MPLYCRIGRVLDRTFRLFLFSELKVQFSPHSLESPMHRGNQIEKINFFVIRAPRFETVCILPEPFKDCLTRLEVLVEAVKLKAVEVFKNRDVKLWGLSALAVNQFPHHVEGIGLVARELPQEGMHLRRHLADP